MIPTGTSLHRNIRQSVALRLLQPVTRSLHARGGLFALAQNVGTQVLIIVVNILTGVLTARLLGPEGRGVYTAVTTWPQMFATLALSGLGSAIVFRMRKRPEAVSAVAGAALWLVAVHSAIAVAIGLAALPVLMGRYDASVLMLARMGLATVWVNSTYMMMKQAFAGLKEFGSFNRANLWSQLLYLLTLLAFLPFGPLTANRAICAMFGSSLLALLMMGPRFLCLVRPRLTRCLHEARHLVSFSSRAALSDIVFALVNYADRFVLIPFLPAGDLGFYSVAFSFSRLVQLVVQPAIAAVVFSHMSGQSETRGKALHDEAFRFLMAGLVAGTAALWLVGEPLLVFTYGHEFAAAITVFRLLLVEASLGVLSQVTVQLFLSRDRPGVVSGIQAGVLCISIGALLVLVPRYGGAGAAAGLVIAGTARLLLLLASIKIVLRLPLPRLRLSRADFRHLLGRLP